MHTAKTSELNNLVLHHKTVNTYQLKYTKFQEIGFRHENGLIETGPLKWLFNWQGQPRVIIYINFVELEIPKLFGFEWERFLNPLF